METDQGEREHESMTGTMMTSSIYDDDEPVTWQPANAAGNGVLEFSAHCEYPTLPNDVARDGFAVMVHLRAPAQSAVEARRAPLDLVAVLDVGDSMSGAAKLEQVKRAVGFVVNRLGPRDRLSVVAALSGDARRVTPLTRMTEDGKAAAKRAVEALEASGCSTNVRRSGLDEAAKVLGGSRHWNDVAGVILLSDGRDVDYPTSDSCVVLPEFLRRRAVVHTFGLGSDVDAAAMHKIAEATGGTFSFVEDHADVQDALAQCVDGLRSVTAQGVWIEVETFSPGVRMTAVKSGRYENSLKGEEHRDYEATVNVGELYADEERRFLFFLDVPGVDDAGDSLTLVRTRCSYIDVATGQSVDLEFAETYADVLSRDEATADVARCKEVERELLRVAAAEDMALAREAAERGDYDEAARILDARRESLSRSAPALSGDAVCTAVAAELHELSHRVSDEQEYRKTGRACLLAAMSSHAQQRGFSVRLSRPLAAGAQFGCVGSSSVFATPAMRKMEKLSEMLRKQQEARPPQPLPENGSKSVRPRSRLEARLASSVPRLSMLGRYRRLLLKR